MKLGEYLLQQGIIDERQLNIALNEQRITGERLGEILIRLNFAKRKDIISALTILNPQALIGEEFFVRDVPVKFLQKTKTIILGDAGDKLYITTLNENPQKVAQTISEILRGKQVELVSYPVDFVYQKLRELELFETISQEEKIQKFIEEDDIPKAVNEIIIDALKKRSSDIHIEPQEKVLLIRYRIDGVLYIMYYFPLSIYPQLVASIKNRAGMDIAETKLPQDGSFLFQYYNRYINLRVATLPTANGEKVSIRILDREKMLLDIKELGITKLDEWLKISQNQMGLVLVCGPTGSGKTTTLYATLQWLDRISKSVYSIEDPIEYQLPFINQVQINRRAGLDFAMYLRTIVRHDPDVIVVGEIRDKETAENAMTLADTGHLVYSTLHTNDIPSTLIRLKNLGVDINSLAFLLKGILVQRLVRKVCMICRGQGCENCLGIGYYGRTVVSEIARFENYKEVFDLMNGNFPYYSFYEDCKRKVQNGITTPEEILRAVGIIVDY